MDPLDATRVDRWLWAVRVCRTRSEATDLCRGGHVRVNHRPVKPSARVAVGDRVEVRVHGRDRILEVARAIDRRVGAPAAAGCYVDRSPPAPKAESALVADRARGSGRPTKRDRRRMDRWNARRR